MTEPMDIVHTPPGEVTLVFERLSSPWRIYTDGRALPDVSKMPPSYNGYSVGHWEGDTFVVQTTGVRTLYINPRPIVRGDGYTTPNNDHLADQAGRGRPDGRAIAAGLALSISGLASAAHAAAPPNLTGAWVIDPESFNPPPAQPTAAAARKRAAIVADKAAGSEAYAQLWCTYVGLPQSLVTTIPISVRQTWREVVMLSPIRSEPRHIYLDPRIKPDRDTYDTTTNGYSTGRWRGKDLVVQTEGFGENGVLTLPGGALKSPESRLREVIRLVDPDTLRITATWTDRTTLKRPYTYTQQFKRVAEPVWYTDSYCTPVKAMRAKNLPLPPGEGGE